MRGGTMKFVWRNGTQAKYGYGFDQTYFQPNKWESAELEVPSLGATLCETAIAGSEDSTQKTADRTELSGWAQGFLSGLFTAYTINYAKSQGYDPAVTGLKVEYDSSHIWDKVIKHCRNHPQDNVASAVMSIYTNATSD